MATRKEPEIPARDAEQLRAQAKRCFRLARSITDESIARELEVMGRELEQKAAEIERAGKERDA
jgi:hypothetical protein